MVVLIQVRLSTILFSMPTDLLLVTIYLVARSEDLSMSISVAAVSTIAYVLISDPLLYNNITSLLSKGVPDILCG